MNFIGDFHVHTIASGDAFGTIREIVAIAKEKGFKCIAITEHGPAMEASAHYYYFESLIANVIDECEIILYSGVEGNIMDEEGTLDLPDSTVERLEFVVASFHPFSWEDKGMEINTKALKSCLLRYNVKSIAHLNYPYYPINIDEIIPILLEKNIAIEINNKALKKHRDNWRDFRDMIIKCKERGVKVLVNSDAHYTLQVGVFDTALEFIDYCGLEKADILNTDFEELTEYFKLRNKATTSARGGSL